MTGVSGLRGRKREKTRDALVASATHQFARRGFDRVPDEEIAESCDVYPRTFLRYFASIEAVLVVDSDAPCAQLEQALAEQSADDSSFQALEAAVRMLVAGYAEQHDVVRARHDIVTTTPSLRARATERQQGWETSIVQELRSSGRARDLNDFDLRLLVAGTVTALRVAVEAWVAGDVSEDLGELLDHAFTRLRVGMDSPPS